MTGRACRVVNIRARRKKPGLMRQHLTAVNAAREIGRATQGVTIIRPDEGDKVVAVARIAKEGQDDENTVSDADAEAEAGATPAAPASQEAQPRPLPQPGEGDDDSTAAAPQDEKDGP